MLNYLLLSLASRGFGMARLLCSIALKLFTVCAGLVAAAAYFSGGLVDGFPAYGPWLGYAAIAWLARTLLDYAVLRSATAMRRR